MPALYLVRPQEGLVSGIIYQAVDNMKIWALDSIPNEEMPPDAYVIGTINISRASDSESSMVHDISIDSRSFCGLMPHFVEGHYRDRVIKGWELCPL